MSWAFLPFLALKNIAVPAENPAGNLQTLRKRLHCKRNNENINQTGVF